jgi:hypothetical protein
MESRNIGEDSKEDAKDSSKEGKVGQEIDKVVGASGKTRKERGSTKDTRKALEEGLIERA